MKLGACDFFLLLFPWRLEIKKKNKTLEKD